MGSFSKKKKPHKKRACRREHYSKQLLFIIAFQNDCCFRGIRDPIFVISIPIIPNYVTNDLNNDVTESF